MTPKAIRALVDDLATQQYETSNLLPRWIPDLGTPYPRYLAYNFVVLDCVDRMFRFWSDDVAKALASIRPKQLIDCASNYFNDGSREFRIWLSQGFEFDDGSVAIYHCVQDESDYIARYYHAPSAADLRQHPVVRVLPAFADNRLWIVDTAMSSVAYLNAMGSPLLNDPAFRKWLIDSNPECFLGTSEWSEDEIVYALRTCRSAGEILVYVRDEVMEFTPRLWAEYWLSDLTGNDSDERRDLLEDMDEDEDEDNTRLMLDTYTATIALVGEGLADDDGNADMNAIAAIRTSMRAVFEQLGYLPPNSEHEPLLFGINNPQAV
jgi:hypothetical protein